MLVIPIADTENALLDKALYHHFADNLLVMVEGVVISASGLTIDEFSKRDEKEAEQLVGVLFPQNTDTEGAVDILKSVEQLLISQDQIQPTAIEEYVIVKAIEKYCDTAEDAGLKCQIPFLLREELFQYYKGVVREDIKEWSDLQVEMYAGEMTKSIENVREWPTLIFDDLDYELPNLGIL